MSLGDAKGRGNGNSNKLFENTYYSRVGFKDYDRKLKLGFQFKSGMLVVDISKEKDGFEFESLVNIFITPTKAKILSSIFKQFENDIENGTFIPGKGYGINAGMGEIVSVLILGISEDGKKMITIGKVNGDGKFTEKVDYIFNTDFHYGLKWANIDSMNCEKMYDNDVEYNQFVDTINQFALASNGAYAYSVADLTRYDTRSILNKMNPIYDKLGIERNSKGSGNNFFNRDNNRNSGSAEHKSYDDMMDDLPFDED